MNQFNISYKQIGEERMKMFVVQSYHNCRIQGNQKNKVNDVPAFLNILKANLQVPHFHLVYAKHDMMDHKHTWHPLSDAWRTPEFFQ